MVVTNDIEKREGGGSAEIVKRTELKVELFKYFGNSKISKTSKSPRKRKRDSPIIILPQMRKTRLKSDVFVENMVNVLPDGDYDISKEDFDSAQITNKMPTKNKDTDFQSNPARRRSMRLKSIVLDRSYLSLSDGDNVENFVSKTGIDAGMNTNKIKTKNYETPIRKRKISTEEPEDNLLDSINVDAIADMLMLTDIHSDKVLENPNISRRSITTSMQHSESPNKRHKCTEETDTKRHITQTANFNIHLKNDTQIPTAKTKRKIKSAKELCSRTERSSIKDFNNVLQGKISHANETNKEEVKHSSGLLNISSTDPKNKIGILKYFKVTNKHDQRSNSKDSPKKQKSVVQSSELISDTNLNLNKSNNQQNFVQMPPKRARTRSPLSEQQCEDSPKMQKEAVLSSKLIPDSSVSNNCSQMLPKRVRGRPPLAEKQCKDSTKMQKKVIQSSKLIPDSSVSNNCVQLPPKRRRGRPALSEQQCKHTPTMPKKVVQNSKPIPDSSVSNNCVQITPKRGRGRPPLAEKRKNNVSKQPKNYPYTKISKLTKEQIKNVPIRKIPKDRLDDVLNMIDDEDHPIWDDRNTSCNPYIFNHWNPRNLISDQNIKIKYARQFLLRRDWISLSKILSLFNATAKGYYPLLAKYSSLLLAHTDREQFNKLIQFLTNLEDSNAVMEKCSKIRKRNDESI